MIHTTENFFNKVATDIRYTYFPNEKHGETRNENYHNATYTMELFNNGCLTYRSFIGRLAKSCNDSTAKIHGIVQKYIVSFGQYQYKPTEKPKYICLDNGGETFDRYTIIEVSTGEMIGASDNPFYPLGFGQYCGNVADNYWRVAYGYNWRNGCDKRLLNKRIKYALDLFIADCGNVGKRVEFETLPDEVKKYINHAFSTEQDLVIPM